ncbi:MAG: DUF368 domain-containing protein [Peptoniphilaceae bacterium]|nr:DUF368 domain-containing protein [Peptoniphilaceae bacterium]
MQPPNITDSTNQENDIAHAPDAQPGVFPWMLRLLKGILIGIGAILPGLSGGVLAVIFGFYPPLIHFLSDIRREFWKNVRYFIPIGIGVLGGVFLFSVFVKNAFGRYEAQFVCLFIGFVIGTFPSLFRAAGQKGRGKRDWGILALFTLLIFGLMYIGRALPHVQPSIPVWFFSGMLVALGFIVPGMSPSNFLIYFGLYDKMAAGIESLQLSMLIPFGLGGILCVILFSKLVAWLFKRYYSGIYHAILGMVIGSTLGIFPSIVFPAYQTSALRASGMSLFPAVIFGIVMLIAGIVISFLFSRLEERVEYER